ncbi:hypothetical protein LCGC14_3161780 [marine sediment metagenome]|uniref:Uncharacterized protein n=1 Tax=marine sediment metagenome TaxID=412755 RepID=A0A0F8WF77_9ZZZZ
MRAGENESYLKQYYWLDGGTITVQQALLGAAALTHAAVEALAAANKVLIQVPQGWIALELRFYSDSAAGTIDIVELYAAATSDSRPDHYRHFAQLTLTVGTQEYGSNKFHDTVVAVSNWLTNKGTVSPANDTFGSYVFNLHGHGSILAIASTKGSTTLFCDYKKV